MPEGYTHVKYANRAATLAGLDIQNKGAFALGANGPDPLFFYQSWLPPENRKPDLHPLGEQMHMEQTGAFLKALLRNAHTRTQWDYVLGFLCHYGMDSTLHPFVEAMRKPGKPYDMPGGHGFLEIGLDSYEYRQDHGTGAIPAAASSPKLPEGQLLQIAGLLSICIQQVYGVRVSIPILKDSFDHMHLVRSLMCAPGAVKRALLEKAEILAGDTVIRTHITPAELWGQDEMDEPWENPFSGQQENTGLFDLLTAGAVRCGVLIVNADLWKRGYRSWNELGDIIGSNGYLTGLPTE